MTGRNCPKVGHWPTWDIIITYGTGVTWWDKKVLKAFSPERDKANTKAGQTGFAHLFSICIGVRITVAAWMVGLFWILSYHLPGAVALGLINLLHSIWRSGLVNGRSRTSQYKYGI